MSDQTCDWTSDCRNKGRYRIRSTGGPDRGDAGVRHAPAPGVEAEAATHSG